MPELNNRAGGYGNQYHPIFFELLTAQKANQIINIQATCYGLVNRQCHNCDD